MEFEDYLIASGVRVEPDEDEDGRRVDVDHRDIINKFKASLKNNARVWYSMYIDGRITDLYSEAGWKTIKSKFLTYFNPIGSTKEQQIKAWKELKWKLECYISVSHVYYGSSCSLGQFFSLCITYNYTQG